MGSSPFRARRRRPAIRDGVLAGLVLLAVGLLLWASHVASERVVREYGYNVDSGVYEGLLAIALLPASLLFGAASIAQAVGSRLGRGLHLVANVCGVLTLVGLLALAVLLWKG